jgi:hypothetical protein
MSCISSSSLDIAAEEILLGRLARSDRTSERMLSRGCSDNDTGPVEVLVSLINCRPKYLFLLTAALVPGHLTCGH